ncbi:MAG: DNA polymerase III subunit beta [Candidatus Levybacteria bacterium RIFCSPLOWO2_01_FULL_38_13]|nr:MAG: DNA polymerase III subunit beta [Candidatus Levybacteria bacterium RIFCSPLOWO2_01_FULL_38_13]
MKASFLCENVDKKLSFVNHAVSQRSQLPILLNFHIQAKKGNLIIKATDLEIGIQVSIPANVEQEGEATVPARAFYDLLSNVQKGIIFLATKDNNLIFGTDKIKTVFQTTPAGEFPKIYEEKGGKIATIPEETIEKEFSSVVFAASPDPGRPALSGVLIKKISGGKEGFLMVATDGFRLSFRGTQNKNTESDGGFVVPARIIKELSFMKDNKDVGVYVSKKGNQILFEQEGSILVGRLIEAKFPNYQKIIPQDFSTRAEFDKTEFQSAVKTCAVFAREAANIIKLSILKNKIKVWASAPSLGETEIDVDAEVLGEENEIAFNARYLLEFLSNIEGEVMVFEMAGPLNPGVFKLKDDPSFLHIIMPIRLQAQ